MIGGGGHRRPRWGRRSGLVATSLALACTLDPNPSWGGGAGGADEAESAGDESRDESDGGSEGRGDGEAGECPNGSALGAATHDDPDGVYCMIDQDGDGWGIHDAPVHVAAGRDCDDEDPARALCASSACVDAPGGSAQLAVDPWWDGYQWGCAPGVGVCGLLEDDAASVAVAPTVTATYGATAWAAEALAVESGIGGVFGPITSSCL